MGTQNFVVSGGIKMPIGFRFHPTDEELVVHYLKRKALSLPLPASIISEFDVLQTQPWSLPGGELNENRYFFSSRHGDGICKKRKRVAGCGYWKPIGQEKPILASGTNRVVGMRQVLIFCHRKRSNQTSTRWFLHQYRLVSEATFDPNSVQMDWSVFRVFQRKIKAKQQGLKVPGCIDFPVEDCSMFGPPQPTSSSSSEITEVSFTGLDEEDSRGALLTSYTNLCIRK